ncbi:ORF6N domain-containing protein [Campylobacter coli]
MLQSLKSAEVAVSYEVTSDTIRKHFENHKDEFIENTHFYYEINPQFNTKVIKWTLEGVYMLGFFIKSPKAKEYRKKVAKLLREQSEARFKALSSENKRLNSLNHHQKIGYKSQLAQQKEKYENKIKALQYDLEKKNELSFKRKLSVAGLIELRKILAKDYDIVCIKEWEFEFLAEKIALESTRITTWDAVVKKLKQSLDYWQNYEEYEEKWRKILRR